jgi:hypothetical protein
MAYLFELFSSTSGQGLQAISSWFPWHEREERYDMEISRIGTPRFSTRFPPRLQTARWITRFDHHRNRSNCWSRLSLGSVRLRGGSDGRLEETCQVDRCKHSLHLLLKDIVRVHPDLVWAAANEI